MAWIKNLTINLKASKKRRKIIRNAELEKLDRTGGLYNTCDDEDVPNFEAERFHEECGDRD